NDFWRSADAKPVTFAERLNLAEGYINERLVACGEAWQLRCPEATRPASALASPNSKKVVALPNPAREQSQLAWLLKEQRERGAWGGGGPTGAVRGGGSHGRHRRTGARDRLPRGPLRRSG